MRDERQVAREEGQAGPGETASTVMAPFHQGVVHTTSTGGTA